MNRSRLSTVIALAAASVLTQAVIAQTGGATGAGGGAGSQTGGAATGAQTGGATGAAGSGASVPGADRKFAMMVAENDLAELQISNLALQKAGSDQVKQLAQKLIDDHTKTSNSMKEIASKKGLTLPTQPDAKHQALATKLQGESGDQFDKDYLKANSADHHKVVKAFEKEANSGQDPDIKSFASQYLPAIQEHTKMIDGDKGQTQTGGSK